MAFVEIRRLNPTRNLLKSCGLRETQFLPKEEEKENNSPTKWPAVGKEEEKERKGRSASPSSLNGLPRKKKRKKSPVIRLVVGQ